MLTNEVIHEVSELVNDSDDVYALIQELKNNLTINAVGIAAPQIGVLKRVILCKIKGIWIPMINPTWIPNGNEKRESKEGCLSFPGKFVWIKRHFKVIITYQDELLNQQELRVFGLAAYIVQHEVDHLNGITI